ncbi:hypothetical protein ACHQM5_029306 [Ranunculus cassubicifolius]
MYPWVQRRSLSVSAAISQSSNVEEETKWLYKRTEEQEYVEKLTDIVYDLWEEQMLQEGVFEEANLQKGHVGNLQELIRLNGLSQSDAKVVEKMLKSLIEVEDARCSRLDEEKRIAEEETRRKMSGEKFEEMEISLELQRSVEDVLSQFASCRKSSSALDAGNIGTM